MSFASVVEQLDAVEVPSDGPSLAVAVRAHDRYTAKLALAVGAFDAAGEWDVAGYTSSAIAWLRDLGLDHGDAAELVKIAGKLRRLPLTAEAWVAGRLSGGQVKVICAKVIDRHVELFAAHEADLLPGLEQLGVLATKVAMRVWRDRADAINPGPRPKDDVSQAWLSPTLDDRGVLTAHLDAEAFGLAFEAMRIADSGDLDVQAPLRRGQALADIFRHFLDNHSSTRLGRNVPHLTILINGETLGTKRVEGYVVGTGQTLPPEALERYLCDCAVHSALYQDDTIVKYGRAVKDPPAELARYCVVRDQHCRWKGCDRPASWCHLHHVKQWERDHGHTNADNLVLLCARHHGTLHRKGWSGRLKPDGTLTVTNANGQSWTTTPPSAQRLPRVPRGPTTLEQHLATVHLESIVRAGMHKARAAAA